ncbi:MAG: hypothetical protein QF926_02640 [Alphaproteobacteria bacterium]|jgi:EAL domain-containing protein (putative c-di-GMP-specific phosphodiesterase class I)|nr:hypothetical protein [Alphaproteobacteria bacterium]MDP6515508.1 hypothetical protein [Alphaproteobacteria bacterium]|tara:strand:- start:197 stop:403 length:207 start_codon:yes stop_codon:yes gene_type:complete
MTANRMLIIDDEPDIGAFLKTVAERVGFQAMATVEFLREAGCDTGQGYYFGRPVPADKYDHLFAAPTA